VTTQDTEVGSAGVPLVPVKDAEIRAISLTSSH